MKSNGIKLINTDALYKLGRVTCWRKVVNNGMVD